MLGVGFNLNCEVGSFGHGYLSARACRRGFVSHCLGGNFQPPRWPLDDSRGRLLLNCSVDDQKRKRQLLVPTPARLRHAGHLGQLRSLEGTGSLQGSHDGEGQPVYTAAPRQRDDG